jgi:hypothetical protein
MTHLTGGPGTLHDTPRPSAPSSVNTAVFRQLLEQYADTNANKAQRAAALANLVDHLDTQVAVARYQALFEELPADQAMLGERITRKSYETLSSLSTYMAVALQLLPTVSWHDGATASAQELKALLQRNFAVQITLEESRGAYSTAPMHAPAEAALKLPREWYGNEVPRGVVAGFHAYISDVLALRCRPAEVNELPKPLRWLDRVDSSSRATTSAATK